MKTFWACDMVESQFAKRRRCGRVNRNEKVQTSGLRNTSIAMNSII